MIKLKIYKKWLEIIIQEKNVKINLGDIYDEIPVATEENPNLKRRCSVIITTI